VRSSSRGSPEFLAHIIVGPEPPPGTDTWFSRGTSGIEELRAERARLRLAFILAPRWKSSWHEWRLRILEDLLG